MPAAPIAPAVKPTVAERDDRLGPRRRGRRQQQRHAAAGAGPRAADGARARPRPPIGWPPCGPCPRGGGGSARGRRRRLGVLRAAPRRRRARASGCRASAPALARDAAVSRAAPARRRCPTRAAVRQRRGRRRATPAPRRRAAAGHRPASPGSRPQARAAVSAARTRCRIGWRAGRRPVVRLLFQRAPHELVAVAGHGADEARLARVVVRACAAGSGSPATARRPTRSRRSTPR